MFQQSDDKLANDLVGFIETIEKLNARLAE
jgi:hypothetical protein